MPALYSHTTRANGTVLTATIYNGDHQNHIDNGVPAQLDDYSVNVGQMQSQVSPGGVGSESLPTSLAGELERIRYVLARIQNTTFWYGGGSDESHALVDVQVFTSGGTWTKPTGTNLVHVRVVGGGGGSGGCAATGAGQGSAGGGGGGGGYCEEWISSGIGATETVTVGAAGTGGSAGANAGGNGGTSSFGSHCQATGGSGGGGGSAAAIGAGGAGGSGGAGSGGNINAGGDYGTDGFVISPSGGNQGGRGGSSSLGGGGRGASGSGVAGSSFGGGGGGPSNAQSGSALAGSAGAAGIVIVESFT